MRIKIKHSLNQLSAVRGIGSYAQMLQEAVTKYGLKQEIQLDSKQAEVDLITDFNPFIKFKIDTALSQVAIVHDLIPIKYPSHFPVGIRGKIIWWQNRQQLRKLTGIITDSQVVKTELVDLLSLESNRVQVVYPAAKQIFEQHQPAQKPNFYSLLPKEFVLYTGDITWNKNLPRLAKAIKQLKKPLVLAGKALTATNQVKHPWLKNHFKFSKETASHKNFIFLGYVSDPELLWLYQNTKVLALPSLAEGFGLTWLEASWQGTPAVVGKSQLTEEIMGQTPFYCDPYHVGSITSALQKAWSSSSRRSLLLSQAAKYTQAAFVLNLKKALLNLLKKK